jgi:cyanophycinase
LRKGLEKGRHTDRGLGFVGTDWFVDQHFLQRGRFARTIVAMRDHGYRRGVGVAEDSAIVVADGRSAEVVGRRGAVLVDMAEATTNQGAPVTAKGVKLSFLAPGDRFDLETGAVTPSERKKAGTEIRPDAPGFKPYHNDTGAFWYPDMLGPQMLYEAMSRVLDSRSGQARGLAFGDPAGEGADPLGFEFLLTRGPDTMGWFASDPSNYTVLNVRLELRPVRMTRPLYTPVN